MSARDASFIKAEFVTLTRPEAKKILDEGRQLARTLLKQQNASRQRIAAVDARLKATFNVLLNKAMAETAALTATIESSANEILTELIEATPVSQTRVIYYKGTHSNHGATKASWKLKVGGSASKHKLVFTNRYPDRVKYVEHGFARPAKHRALPYPPKPPLLMGMAWQMSTDDKKKVRYYIPPLPRIPGLFFVAKAKNKLHSQLQHLYETSGLALIDSYSVEFGADY